MRFTAAIFLALFAIAAIGMVNWHLANSQIDVTPINSEHSTLLPDNPSDPISLRDRDVTLFQATNRPLFSMDRKPWAPPQAAVVPPPFPLPDLQPAQDPQLSVPMAQPPAVTLVGIQKTPKGSMVLLSDQSGAAPFWLRDGEVYQDWHVANITGTSADLENANTKITLQLYPVNQHGSDTP